MTSVAPPGGASSGAATQAATQAGPIYKLAIIANYNEAIVAGNNNIVDPNSIKLNTFHGVSASGTTGKKITTDTVYDDPTPDLANAADITSAFEPFEDNNAVDYTKIERDYVNERQANQAGDVNYVINAADQEFNQKSLIVIYLSARTVGGQWNTVKSDGSAEVAGDVNTLEEVNNRIYITDATGVQLRTKAEPQAPQTKYYQIKIRDSVVTIYKDGVLINYVEGEIKTTLAYLLKALLGKELTFGDNVNVHAPREAGPVEGTAKITGGKKSKKQRRKGGKKSKKRRSMRRLKRSRARK